MWKERAKKKWLVLVDEQEDLDSTSPVMALWDALIKVNKSVHPSVSVSSYLCAYCTYKSEKGVGRRYYECAIVIVLCL